jgi:hypothetical protein
MAATPQTSRQNLLLPDDRYKAVFSPERKYRYRWWYVWDKTKPRCLYVMLNPSTADELGPDPTIRRCIGFARLWGFGAVEVCNLFAWRSTDPDVLVPELHVGHVPGENDRHILEAAGNAQRIVCAWGSHRSTKDRGPNVLAKLRRHHGGVGFLPHPLSRKPAHPLYLLPICGLTGPIPSGSAAAFPGSAPSLWQSPSAPSPRRSTPPPAEDRPPP